MTTIVLASQSPRRKEILANAGIACIVRPSGVPEEVQEGESPEQFVQRLAHDKAAEIRQSDDEIVLGADTVVVVDEEILGKPKDRDDAVRMLRLLSGRKHEVLTGVCLLHSRGAVVDLARTSVEFGALSPAEIDEYIDSGECMDKAGAYGIQGRASKFITRIEGDYFNIVGLPIALVYRLLKSVG